MNSYQPSRFWENTHADVPDDLVQGGRGIRSVGGGASAVEANYLYRLRGRALKSALGRTQRLGLPSAELRVFEFGCGSGYWLTQLPALLSDPRLSFTGADISPTAIRRLQARYPDAHFVCLDHGSESWFQIESLAPFDLTLAIDVLYHIVDDFVWRDSLRRLVQLTSPEGFLIFSDYGFAQLQEHPTKQHVKHRPLQMYLNELDVLDMDMVAIVPKFYLFNRIKYGPWKDHGIFGATIWRMADRSRLMMHLLYMLDSQITRLIRPMDPRCKARFFVCRRAENTVDRRNIAV